MGCMRPLLSVVRYLSRAVEVPLDVWVDVGRESPAQIHCSADACHFFDRGDYRNHQRLAAENAGEPIAGQGAIGKDPADPAHGTDNQRPTNVVLRYITNASQPILTRVECYCGTRPSQDVLNMLSPQLAIDNFDCQQNLGEYTLHDVKPTRPSVEDAAFNHQGISKIQNRRRPSHSPDPIDAPQIR